jgi:aspartate aminotransferase
MAGGTPIPVPVDIVNGLQFDIDLLREKMNPRTKMIVLNSPNNPSGAGYPKETLMQVAALAQEHDAYLLSDEIYEKIIYDGDPC